MRAARCALLAAALLLAPELGSPQTPSPDPSQSPARVDPLWWRARSGAPGGGLLYLLGSVHLGTQRPLELPDALEAAARGSDELVLELDLSSLNFEELSELARERGTFRPPANLRGALSAPTWELLDAHLRVRGARAESVAALEPWYLASVLTMQGFAQAGYDAQRGVDRRFAGAAAEARTPVVGLETPAAQIEVLDGLPAAIQELMLRDALLRAGQGPDPALAFLGAWMAGDGPTLADIFFAPLRADASLAPFYERVVFRRNEWMSGRLVELARDGRTRFVVVGVGHMLGAHGIPAVLSQRGFEVERMGGSAAPPVR